MGKERLSALLVQRVGTHLLGWPATSGRGCLTRRRDPQVVGDRLPDVTVRAKQIAERRVVPFCPQVRLIAGTNQLNGEPGAVTRAVNRAFDDVLDIQLRGDRSDVLAAPLVAHRGRTRDDGRGLRALPRRVP